VILYAVVFYDARLYSDALLQIVFAALNGYGWWRWLHTPRDSGKPQVQKPRTGGVAVHLLIGTVGAVALGALMSRYTDAALPWLDASLTAFSLVAQYWMARVYTINWPLWIAVDVVYIGMYIRKDLPLTAALYAGFIVLAAYGWREWHRAARARS
jgi:nicotinamide mononucleotide transporter